MEVEAKGQAIVLDPQESSRLWPIVAIRHRMFNFAIEQSECLRLCVYVSVLCVCVCVCVRVWWWWCVCVCVCVCHHFVCMAEVPDSCVPVQYML